MISLPTLLMSTQSFFFLCGFEGAFALNHSGKDNGEATPVPIPNTEVKLSCAENTWLETARENRYLPDTIPR